MLFRKTSFLISILPLAGLFNSANAACYNSGPKEYCLTNKRYACPPGCYCTGATGDYGALDRKGNGKDDISKTDVENWCKVGIACPWKDGTGQCGTSDLAKIFRCPVGFPFSDGSTSSIYDCYDSNKVHYKEITCESGKYLPKGAMSCEKCKSRYYVCVGGTFPSKPTSDQGISKCPSNQIANSQQTSCSDSIYCEPGLYLPANETEPVPCNGVKSYCPGGTFSKASKKQGIFDCPNGSRANKDKTACTVTLVKAHMKKCWTDYNDPDKYKTCVLAKRFYK